MRFSGMPEAPLFIIFPVVASLAIGFLTWNVNNFLGSLVLLSIVSFVSYPAYGAHKEKIKNELNELFRRSPRIEITKPEHWALAIFVVSALLIVVIAERSLGLEDWRWNCKPGFSCSNPLIAFGWWLLMQALAVLGGGGAIGYLIEKNTFYPPPKQNPIPYLACYVIIGLSIVIFYTYWLRLAVLATFFLGGPIVIRWMLAHSFNKDKENETAAYKRCKDLAATVALITPEEFVQQFCTAHERRWSAPLPPVYKAIVETFAEARLPNSLPDIPAPKSELSVTPISGKVRSYELLEQKIIEIQHVPLILAKKLHQAIDAITGAIPPTSKDTSSLTVPAAEIVADLPSVINAIVDAFATMPPVEDIGRVIRTNWDAVAREILSEKEFESAQRVHPKDYPLSSKAGMVQAYLGDTPFAPMLLAPRGLPLPAETRFRHQWIIGDTGAGKTTFLSAMIADDLKRVARNEASVFVMDSQNELIPDIAKLKVFAPGRPLHGKLVYLEPDPDYPLALNIFDVDRERMAQLSSRDRMMLESGAMWMVEFFLSSLVKAEASPHQDIFLNYTIPALMAIPNATIFDFKNLLEPAKVKGGPTGYDRYKQHFTNLRPDTQQWLAERMHSPEVAVTRNAIRARLDGFTSRGFFHDMFSHPRNKLDLFKELQSSKVILVNTMKGLLKSGTEPFGRYFIARLVQAMEERMFLDRGVRLPVFTYIDEASDYIAEEENVEELVDRARKQRMGFVFANQRESQITSSTVRDALSRVAIHAGGEAQGEGKPLWKITIDRREPVQVAVPNVRFQDLPKMTDAEHQAQLQEMRQRYAASPTQYPPEPAIGPDTRVSRDEGGTEAAQDY